MDLNTQRRRQMLLGRLVEDSGLADLAGSDFAALFGGLLGLADTARPNPPQMLEQWRARLQGGAGKRDENLGRCDPSSEGRSP